MNNMTGHIQNLGAFDRRLLRSVCILGKGVTGEAVEGFFRSLPEPVEITCFTDDAEVTGSFDLAVVSPGIPPFSVLVTSARRQAKELISEPELAFRIAPKRWIVVTGTNGKTTTTALTAHVLNACGMKARAAGNIGVTTIEAVCQRAENEYIVAELSSYQLAYSATIAPEAAILLNITPDHLSWHGSFEAYRDAKLSLFRRMGNDSPAVIDATLEETRTAAFAHRDAGGRVIFLGSDEGLTTDMAVEAAFVDPATDMLTFVIGGHGVAVIEASRLQIRGAHNQQNALAAAAVALSLGADPSRLADGLASFAPLEHRIEPCGTVRGIGFFNDSKATNPEATLKALAAFEGKPLIVMLGGRDKGTLLNELVDAAQSTCRAVVCYGEAGPRFAEAFSTKTFSHKAFLVDDFTAAFAKAVALAQPGDVVLLSPACASFDEFNSYEHRGKVFKELVRALELSDQPNFAEEGGGHGGN